MKYKFQGEVVDGKIKVDRQKYFNTYVKTFEGQKIEIAIQKKSTARSGRQNRYFHGVVCKYWGEYVGHDIETMKGVLKGKFLKRSVMMKGKEVEFIRDTSSLTVAEMKEFIDQCVMLAIEYGIVIPSPEEAVY